MDDTTLVTEQAFDSAWSDAAAEAAADIKVDVAADLGDPDPIDDAPDADDEPIQTDPAEELKIDEPAEEVADPLVAKPDEKPAEEAKDDELPEGVKVAERGGKKVYTYEEHRHARMQESNKLRGELERTFGLEAEPGKAIPVEKIREELEVREAALMGARQLQLDVISADPGDHSGIARHFIHNIDLARKSGDIDHNPMPSIIGQMLVEGHKADPTVVTALVDRIFTDPQFAGQDGVRVKLIEDGVRATIDDLYAVAAAATDKKKAANLFTSIQWVDRELFGQHRNAEGKVLAADGRTIQPSQPRVEPRERTTERGAPHQDGRREYATETEGKADAAIRAEVDKVFAEFKEPFAAIGKAGELDDEMDLLNGKIRKALRGDQAWIRNVKLDLDAALRSKNPQTRSAQQTSIVNRHLQRAREVIQAERNAIQQKIGRLLEGRAKDLKARAANAQTKKGPAAPGAPVPKPLMPLPETNGAPINADQWDKLWSGLNR